MTSVLITGASRGIGRGLVTAFAVAGWDVVVTARQSADAEEVAAAARADGARAIGVACDVTTAGDVDRAVARAVEEFGGLDAFVHNAVSGRSSEPVDLEHASAELWQEHAAVALRGMWRAARVALAPLRARRGAMLIVTSAAGINGSAALSFYAAVKGGQRAFVRSLAREWAPHDVRVNGLAPLAVTDALENAFRLDPTLRERVTSSIPMGRFGDAAADIGPAAVFLCGDGARYVTGQTLAVDGGQLTVS